MPALGRTAELFRARSKVDAARYMNVKFSLNATFGGLYTSDRFEPAAADH